MIKKDDRVLAVLMVGRIIE
jgi:NAD kinase